MLIKALLALPRPKKPLFPIDCPDLLWFLIADLLGSLHYISSMGKTVGSGELRALSFILNRSSVTAQTESKRLVWWISLFSVLY